MIRKPLERYSFTSMSTADACLLSYAGRYGNGERWKALPQLDSRPLEAGRIFHHFIELYVGYLQERQMPQDEPMVETFVERAFTEDRETPSTDAWDSVWYGARFFARWYRHDFENHIGAEFRLSRVLAIPGEDDVEIIAFPDVARLAGQAVIFRDWKTGWEAKVSDVHRFQGEVVAWTAASPDGRFAEIPTGYEVAFPRSGVVSESVMLEERDATRVEARMRSIIRRIRSARRANVFPARAGKQCAWCNVAPRCARQLDLREAGVVVADEAAAQEALSEVCILDSALRQRLDALRGFVQLNGPVRANGKVAEYETKESGPRLTGVQPLLERAWAIEHPDAVDRDGNLTRLPDLPPTWALALLSVNGQKTKSKRVQNDPRLGGLWRTETSSEWTIRDEIPDALTASRGASPQVPADAEA